MSEPTDSSIYEDNKKWMRIANLTLSNYSNMNNRLVHKKKIAEAILVYYSVAIIILSVTAKYFPNCINGDVAEYFGIVCSVVLLAYSLVNNTAKYDQRIAECQKVVNGVKTLKREINVSDIGKFKEKYYALIDNAEVRDDIDFFRTLKQQCKEENICFLNPGQKNSNDSVELAELKNHLSEINIFVILLRIAVMYLTDAILLLLPVAIFVLCFLLRGRTSL